MTGVRKKEFEVEGKEREAQGNDEKCRKRPGY